MRPDRGFRPLWHARCFTTSRPRPLGPVPPARSTYLPAIPPTYQREPAASTAGFTFFHPAAAQAHRTPMRTARQNATRAFVTSLPIDPRVRERLLCSRPRLESFDRLHGRSSTRDVHSETEIRLPGPAPGREPRWLRTRPISVTPDRGEAGPAECRADRREYPRSKAVGPEDGRIEARESGRGQTRTRRRAADGKPSSRSLSARS